jgi:hypothetical protein
MTGGDLQIASCHDVGTQADAYGIAVPIMLTELLQVGQTVDIDDDTQVTGFYDLFKGDAVGSVKDPFRGKACLYGKFHFIDGAAVDIGSQTIDIFEDVDIGERLAGVEKYRLAAVEGGSQLVVLLFYLFCVIDV